MEPSSIEKIVEIDSHIGKSTKRINFFIVIEVYMNVNIPLQVV